MDTLRVLVTDDESQMRRAVNRALSHFTVELPEMDAEFGFTVEEANTGEEALEIIKDNPPDIHLLDHKLDGISGLEVLERVGTKENEMLTVMITAYASLETAVAATKNGAYDFIAKPFTPAELKTTVRKAAAHLLMQRQARKLAQEKRQVRFQFISVLAHELKAPLGAVEGYLMAMKNPQVQENKEACDQMVRRCLVRTEGMRKMIGDLLDLTRIESGVKKRELAEVDVTAVAQGAMETVKANADERNIHMKLKTDGPATMNADRGELEIIMNNLVSNAVKYNKDNGRVDVSVDEDMKNDQVVIVVSDTGIGLSQEEADRLFNDFVRIKNDKTRNVLGSGLGLSTVKKLAMLYGGNATVSSEPDKGSTFTVRLDRNAQTEVSDDESVTNTEMAAGG
jgi:signal transduction histidine kinase